MVTIKRFFLIGISVILLIPVVNSCKKGEEDPSFSFYSRKHRLCQDWTFSFLKKTIQHNDTIVSYEFDGSSLKKITGNQVYISSGVMLLSFNKNGTYLWEESITTDTSTYSYNEEGRWYFSGGGSESGTHYKELLALQKTKVTETLQAGGSTNTMNYSGSGNLDATVFRIIKLASDEVKLESRVETNYIQVSPNQSDLQILTIDITLKKSL